MDIDRNTLIVIVRIITVIVLVSVAWASFKARRQARRDKEQAAQWEKETEELLKRERQALNK